MQNLLQLIAITLIILLGFSSCMKENNHFDPYEQWSLEAPLIREYIEKTAGLEDAIYDTATGIWYKIIDEGIADNYEYMIKDTLNQQYVFSKAIVDYEGKLLNGTTFYKTNNESIGDTVQISQNINTGEVSFLRSWIYSFFPKKIILNEKETSLGIIFENGLQPGAEIRIVTPSLYGYGSRNDEKIPANSPLDYQIKVIKMEHLEFEKEL